MSYILQNIIGKGTFGTTFKAVGANGKEVALKAIDIDASERLGVSLNNIAQEAEILKKLSDNGGCGTYVTCYYEGFIANYLNKRHAILVSEFIDGSSLREFIEQGVKSPSVMWPIMTQLLLGLKSIHGMQFAHRDIKPENILITKNNTIKYIDFGISCLQKCSRTVCVDNCKVGSGTILYMSPEILSDKSAEGFDIAKASDVWALAITMFELANGSQNYPYVIRDKLGKLLSSPRVIQNIINAPQLRSNYQLDKGQTNNFFDVLIINDWRARPTIEEAINLFMEIVVSQL